MLTMNKNKKIIPLAIAVFCAGTIALATDIGTLPDLLGVSQTTKTQPISQLETLRGGFTKPPVTASLRTPRLGSLPSTPPTMPIRKPSDFVTDCTVFVDYPQYALYGWMTGFELYEAYMNLHYPKFNCDTIYPFYVTHVGMTIVVNSPGSLYVQGFIADLNPEVSTPECPYPGEFIQITEIFPGYLDQAGVYMLTVDFEEPVAVYGPYFAGLYFDCDLTPMDPGVAIDTVPYLCINYNDWGEGLVDLADNPYYPFPGSIDLYSVGYQEEPQPEINPGDADCNGTINVADAVFLIAYIFGSGPAPCP